MKIYYAKFYQAVQLGKDGHTFIGGKEPKVKGVSMNYDSGLLEISAPSIRTAVVPFSNIMFMHLADEPKAKKA